MLNKKYVFLALVFFTGLAMVLIDFVILIFFDHSFSELSLNFGIPSLIFMAVYCSLLGLSAKCFDQNFMKDTQGEEFYARLQKVGGVPIKMIAFNVVLHALFLWVTFYLTNIANINPVMKTPLFLAALSFGMLVGTFIYVVSDGLVSKFLFVHHFTQYPRDLREGRQALKSMIIPMAAGIMSIIFGCSISMLGIIKAGGSINDMHGSAWTAVMIPSVAFGLCIIVLAMNLKKNTSRVYTSVVEQLENLSSEHKDLTKRITLCSVDEIGTITGMINAFCDQLSKGIQDIKDGQKELSGAGTHLEENATVMAESISKISEAADIVLTKTHDQIEIVNISSKAVNDIAMLIETLEKSVAAQTTSMAQGSSAVEEMVGNIASIGIVTEKMAAQFKTVGEASEEGRRIQDESKERIRAIVEQSQSLQEANKIIATIAAQTNLLAMNAAIEAAHAGEMGRGFSVVADEIRKLAENSSTESKKIGHELKQIVTTIDYIVKDAVSSGKAFAEVSQRINETEKLIIEVDHAIHEQKTGADQVLESLKAMNETNSQVTDYSHQMSKGNEIMLREVNELHDSAAEVSSHMSEVSEGIKKVNEGAKEVSKLAVISRASIEMISAIADGFEV